MVTLLCPVRGCGAPLEREGRALRCPRGHSFDLARSGYANLLQPQDRRAKKPGDNAEAVAARRRLLDAGLGRPLEEAIVDLAAAVVRPGACLDLGCGEGTFLAAVTSRLGLEGVGVDISSAAVDAAARRHPSLAWLVLNADRPLPFGDHAFSLILSIAGRRNPKEARRVLRADGRLVLAVPAEDDLAELRTAVQGAALSQDRLEKAVQELAGEGFALAEKREIRERRPLDPSLLRDLLATTYRGARHREQERAESLSSMEVTLSWRLASFVL